MKKVISVLLALVMLLSFAACGGKETTTDSGKKVLRVGMECGYAPYNWTQNDESNGAVKIHDSSDYAYGYDVMMAKYLADKMGYDVEVYKIDWDSLPTAVISGAIDCVIAGQSITAERLETVDFTAPYFYASIVVLTKGDSKYANATGIKELDGASATSQINTVWYDKCLPQIPNVQQQAAKASAPEMLVALQSGACDVVVTDMPTALAAVASDSTLKILDFSEGTDPFVVSDEDINIGISVKKGNSELLDALNAGLATLTTDDFNSMMNEAIKVQPLSE